MRKMYNEKNSDDFETIDINNDDGDGYGGDTSSLLDFLTKTAMASAHAENIRGKMKPIYLSFYTPTTMVNIQKKTYADSSCRCRLLYNGMICFINVFISIFKYLMTKSNELTIYITRDSDYPDFNYSHVEISTDEYTYVSKWGSDFTRIQGRCLSPDRYGSVCINLSPEDYDSVVSECELAFSNALSFNYIGSTLNFVLPTWVKNIVFENGVYENPGACFCSEFVSRALMKTEALAPLFKKENLVPPLVSPIKLCILVWKFSEENMTNVTPSIKMMKKPTTTKKIIVKT